MLATQAISWQLEDYAYFRKCGEITASPDMQCFGFNCAFCPAICLQFDVFMEHIRSQHMYDMRTRYEGVEEKIEQTTQTDLMIKNMHMDNNNDSTTPSALLDKRQQTGHWNEPNMTTTVATRDTPEHSALGLLDMDMDIELLDIGDTTSAPRPPPMVNTMPLQLNTSEAIMATTAANTGTVPQIDFVYIMENPLPPSPPPSASILVGQQQQCALQSLDPFEMLPAPEPEPTTLELPPTPGVDGSVARPPPRRSARRVAMQRKLRVAINETLDQQPYAEQTLPEPEPEQQQWQLQANAVVELTPPATPPTSPASSTSSASSSSSSSSSDSVSCIDVGVRVSLKMQYKRRELERNREFVGALLLAYKRHEKLWNPKHPDYKYNAKRSTYSELAAPLESAFQMQLSGAEIFAVLKELRGRYRRELSKLNALGAKYKSRLWYFEQMHFLRNVIEHKRAEREAKNTSDSNDSEKYCETDTECFRSAQYHEVLSFILDAFKRQECLWNPQHFDFASCSKNELYDEISAQLLEELNYEMSGDDCFKEIQKLRTRYRKELRMVIKHKGLYLPKLWCYDEMEFLHNILQEQIFKKINKKIGVVESNQRTTFSNADSIEFQSQENELQFVEIYRNYPALWEADHPDFRSNAYRGQALTQMLEELNNTFNTAYSMSQLEKTLFQLRKAFSLQKRDILTDATESSSITLVHAKLAQFLEQNLGPFRCDICSELVKTCDQYKVHRSAHDGTQPFICTLCGKGFQMPCNLTVHIRRHRRDFPYACEQCNKRFATSTEVAIHLRTHTGERPYICDLCGKSFKTWSFFDIHRRTHLNQSTFHCPICDKGFYEKNRFTDHMNGHLNIRKHLCTVCGKSFTTFGNLKKHTELHLPVKKYKCSECGNRFAQFASLRWHKKREHSA